MEQKLAPDLLSALENGEKPKGKSDKKIARKAYLACMAKSNEGLPLGISIYNGPYFDAMTQIDSSVDMQKAVRLIRKAQVDRVALFARSRKRLHQDENNVIKIANENPDLIVLGAPKYFQHEHDIGSAYIQATIDGIDKHGYVFVGEILYTHADKKSGKQHDSGERYTDPLGRGTKKLLTELSAKNIPLMTHWEAYATQRDFPRFHKLYAAWPDQIFIVPHCGFSSAAQAGEILDAHPNVVMTITKKDRTVNDFSSSKKQGLIGSAMLDNFRIVPEWREFLIRYQDRLMAGTDAHMKRLWGRYPNLVYQQRVLLGQLEREAAEKIAYKNAERIYGVRLGR
ncbi:MAG: amidohydrolase family protein [Thermodesulfobacteriota bacterium]|nr:amidohydrolase family protein [Thermodesulfobacteriota bacterium]